MEKKFYQTKLFTTLIISIVALISICFIFGVVVTVGVLKNSTKVEKDISKIPTITISGSADVYTKPDIALVAFSVITSSSNVSEAMNQNTSKMNSIINYIESQGVEEKDIKTTNFNLYPVYAYAHDTGKRTLSGYEVSQSLQIKIRDLSKIGGIISGATDRGANEMSDLQFIVDNDDNLKAQAREKAILDAQNKAKVLADQLGVKLGKIVSFNENLATPTPIYRSSVKLMESSDSEEIPNIQTGENKISATVSITYEIN